MKDMLNPESKLTPVPIVGTGPGDPSLLTVKDRDVVALYFNTLNTVAEDTTYSFLLS